MLIPKTTTIVPIHLPKINPPNNASGDTNPRKGKTHKIIITKNDKDNKIKLVFFNSEKNSILSLMKS